MSPTFFAVKMIFRPYKPYFIFGCRIPFTPGLIYLRKDDIALKVGAIGAQDLVSEKKGEKDHLLKYS